MLVKGLQEAFPTVPVVGVVRKYWNEQVRSFPSLSYIL
jgi:hypothetical protein